MKCWVCGEKYDKDDRIFTTTNELLVSNNNDRSDNYYYKYATGIKTGFTTPSGNCLMASSEKDNFSFISVVLKDGQTKEGLSARYIDTKNLKNPKTNLNTSAKSVRWIWKLC